MHSAQAADPLAAGYYYLLPKSRSKKRTKALAPHAVEVYGPFASSAIARLVQTSARAFGVAAEAPAVHSEVADHVSVLPEVEATRHAAQAVIVRRNDGANVVRLAGRP